MGDGYAHLSHGRGEAAFAFIRATLCIAFSLEAQLKGATLLVITSAGAAAVVYVCLTIPAFYTAAVNHANSAGAFLFAWSSMCMLILAVRQDPKVCGSRIINVFT